MLMLHVNFQSTFGIETALRRTFSFEVHRIWMARGERSEEQHSEEVCLFQVSNFFFCSLLLFLAKTKGHDQQLKQVTFRCCL